MAGIIEEGLEIPCNTIRLQAALKRNPNERGGVVICHPHPLYGGNMDNPVVGQIQAAFFDAGFTTLRFNFRGTGQSTGMFDEGQGEQDDVLACLAFLEAEVGSVAALAGYSFGAWVNARVLDSGRQVLDHVMVSPPAAFMSFQGIYRIPRTGLVVTGEKDDIAPPKDVAALMKRTGVPGEPAVIPGGDHFYSSTLKDLYQVLSNYLS